ncbi:uncharacterized protein LOC108735977 [Agrilus planipennis]|uniref:Uncharacterized protein LOC108735977 n=1 Tax=Agrilus planipennis TaxID=224129 RepID=A0A1W4WUK8_AGRPL|nr:uncharacterized protein LOC108735977 [Agrilus planipennis]
MFGKAYQCLLFLIVVCAFGFEEFFYVFAQISQEMLEQGRNQYQMLRERGSLPQYGPCWKAAIEHVEDGCRALTEEVQSDMALHLTNCFLEMSGHETYNCELNKKPNLKAICINSMSDRAFNVYTEFYTHTQNICWFLRGQVWHETIAENTLKVGKQLLSSAKNQEKLLKGQQESLELQERLLNYGKSLEKVMEEFYTSTRDHQEILKLMTNSLNNLQSWLIGEVSWLDTIVFYLFAIILILFFTASPRTFGARFPIFFLLFLNVCLERLITLKLSSLISDKNINIVHQDMNWYIWTCRYIFSIVSFVIVTYKAFTFKDLNYECYVLLQEIRKQHLILLENIDDSTRNKNNALNESVYSNISENSLSFRRNTVINGKIDSPKSFVTTDEIGKVPDIKRYKSPTVSSGFYNRPLKETISNNSSLNSENTMNSSRSNSNSSFLRVQARYNLRTRTETPEKAVP